MASNRTYLVQVDVPNVGGKTLEEAEKEYNSVLEKNEFKESVKLVELRVLDEAGRGVVRKKHRRASPKKKKAGKS